MELRVTIPCAPIPWARASSGRNGHRFTPAKQRHYMTYLAALFQSEARYQGWELKTKKPIAIEVVCFFQKPRTNKKAQHTQKPDASNLLKIVEDAANGVLYHDDCQIVCAMVFKEWSATPRTEVRVTAV